MRPLRICCEFYERPGLVNSRERERERDRRTCSMDWPRKEESTYRLYKPHRPSPPLCSLIGSDKGLLGPLLPIINKQKSIRLFSHIPFVDRKLKSRPSHDQRGTTSSTHYLNRLSRDLVGPEITGGHISRKRMIDRG
ncbi:hypothetical protein I3842_02G025500 [Carya illinoinensis]|uniref:Uncharacterized protein n=1 Tax=Carya illinoinensis TaxID=32201 RepID=A0A922FN11_CARIL|nr:hypothetical protein I3842_02G025500 [Carya illinoinensis]